MNKRFKLSFDVPILIVNALNKEDYLIFCEEKINPRTEGKVIKENDLDKIIDMIMIRIGLLRKNGCETAEIYRNLVSSEMIDMYIQCEIFRNDLSNQENIAEIENKINRILRLCRASGLHPLIFTDIEFRQEILENIKFKIAQNNEKSFELLWR